MIVFKIALKRFENKHGEGGVGGAEPPAAMLGFKSPSGVLKPNRYRKTSNPKPYCLAVATPPTPKPHSG
jgi:hypothetical protein